MPSADNNTVYQLEPIPGTIIELEDIAVLADYIKTHVSVIKNAIRKFYREQPDIFQLLFIQHHLVPIPFVAEVVLNELVSANILYIHQHDNKVQATVKINTFEDLFLFTDFPTRIKDRSFCFIDEGLIHYKTFSKHAAPYLKDKASVEAWDTCTGAANPLIFMYKNLTTINDHVSLVGTDLNERALAYGEINLLINDVKDTMPEA